jgi:hypothetical protein
MAGSVHIGVLEAIAYARATTPDHLLAMTVVPDGVAAERAEKDWTEQGIDVPLEVVVSPSSSFTAATLAFIDEVGTRWENQTVTVLVPELFVEHWWQHLLHNQSALWLKGRLLFRKETVVTSIPYRVDLTVAGSADAVGTPVRSARPDS